MTCEIPKGKVTAFIGPSGAGKTSLIKCIANLYSHYSGSLMHNGKSVSQLSRRERAHAIGFVFQQLNLFPHLTALENCIYPLTMLNTLTKSQAKEIAMDVLHSLAMDSYKDRYPAKLSGGQQQRVAIARALCLKPQLLLFDEPTSALDPQSTERMMQLLKKLSSQGTTIGISSHDMNLVNDVADQIYQIKDGLIEVLSQNRNPPTRKPPL